MTTANVWTPGSDIPLVNAETTNLEQRFVATAAQNTFTLTAFQYVVGTNSLKIFVNGAKQHIGTNFIEVDSTHFQLLADLEAGETVVAEGIVGGTAALSAQAYADQALVSKNAAAASALAASNSEAIVVASANAAAASETAAALSETNAAASETSAELWATKLTDPVEGGNYSAKQYAANAGVSAAAALDSEAACAAYSNVGFNVSGTLYDFGFITDPSLTFSTDYGSVV